MSASNNKRVHRVIPMNHMLKNRGERESSLIEKLNKELELSYDLIKLSDKEISSRKSVFETFKRVIESEFDCIVEPYGSFRTNLMVHDSDLDITILTKGKNYNRSMENKEEEQNYKAIANNLLNKVMGVIHKNNLALGHPIHIKNARCPIIKCKDKTFQYKIDMSVDKYDAIDSAEFVIAQIMDRPYLKQFVILIKYFLKRRQLSETLRGGLCSYAQFLLILNFIQLHPLIQSNRISVEENMGVLFMDFFQFYGAEFPFDKSVISVKDIKYKPNRDGQINIEDPVNPGHNVAWGCTSLHMIREIFNYSYKIMAAAFANKVNTNKAIGELWLRINEKEMKLRNRNKKTR